MPPKKVYSQISRLFIFITLFLLCFIFEKNFSAPPAPSGPQSVTAGNETDLDVEKTYRDARFSIIVDYLNKKEYAKLSLREKLLLIESQARTARGPLALERMKAILTTHNPTAEVLTTAAILYTSLGRLFEARTFVNRALAKDKNSPRALLAQAMLHLYFQQYAEAEKSCRELIAKNPGWAAANLYLFAGIEIYKGARNAQKLKEMYDLLAKKNKKSGKRYYQNFKANARILKKALKGKLFDVAASADRVTIPFANHPLDNEKKTILLKIKNKSFRVLLDTGNAVGWYIYSRELSELVKAVRGGRAFTRIAIEDTHLEGSHIYCKTVDFGSFKMNHLAGQFVAKPHPDFYDANLNPVFIRSRVISLDFINQQMILSSKEKFDREFASRQGVSQAKLPWYGYERAFVPAAVSGSPGLTMIETGAEDIAIKLDFARKLRLPLKPEKRYLANGKVFQFHKIQVKVSVDKFAFERQNAEVWPLNRIFNPISGLTADVVIGPAALDKNFIVSFDPFEKKVILEFKH